MQPKDNQTKRWPRWVALTALTASLTIPLSAQANHNDPDIADILVGAAVAYVVIDAVRGFDDDHRYYRYPQHSYHDGHRHRPHGAKHHRRHQDKHRHHHKKYRHGKKHRVGHGYRSYDNHYRHNSARYRY